MSRHEIQFNSTSFSYHSIALRCHTMLVIEQFFLFVLDSLVFLCFNLDVCHSARRPLFARPFSNALSLCSFLAYSAYLDGLHPVYALKQFPHRAFIQFPTMFTAHDLLFSLSAIIVQCFNMSPDSKKPQK